jgi:hypothetical protein
LAKNNRKTSSTFFYGKSVGPEEQGDSHSFHGEKVDQEEHGDFQPFLFTGRQLSDKQEQKYCTSIPFFSGGTFGQQKQRGSNPLFSGGSATRKR